MGIISLLRGRDFLLTTILSISVRRNRNVHGYFRRYLSTGANKKGLALMTSPLEGKLIWILLSLAIFPFSSSFLS